MTVARLYRALQPEAAGAAARGFRGAHHAMVAGGIAIMLAETAVPMQGVPAVALAVLFDLIAAFFAAEYVLRLIAAAGAPGAEHRGAARARLAWACSPGGVVDLLGVLPAALALASGPGSAAVFGFLWAFKPVRYAPGLKSLGRVFGDTAEALLSVLLGFAIVLLIAASLAYLLERHAQPVVFGSIPAALWWAIVTLTTTGYGDVVPHTAAGRLLAGLVMVAGILLLALWAGIIASGYAEESQRRDFLHTWDLVAKVPFFHEAGAAVIAEVARLLRPRELAGGATVFHRGERGDCMYFIAAGAVEIRTGRHRVHLGPGQFFGEIALLTSAPRNATALAAEQTTLLTLDIADFHALLARQPALARHIREEAERRLAPPPAAPVPSGADPAR